MPTLDDVQGWYHLPALDLGSGQVLEWTTDGHKAIIGARRQHPSLVDGSRCTSHVWFAVPEAQQFTAGRPVHTVVQWQPTLTLEPSLTCLDCGSHGYIREGVWSDYG